MKRFQPLLASPAPDNLNDLVFPLLTSAKYDGVRAFVQKGVLLSRNLKPIKNEQLQAMCNSELLEGLDGEIISGPPTTKDVFQQSQSLCSRADRHIGSYDRFYVFDVIDAERPFSERLRALQQRKKLLSGGDFVHFVKQIKVNDVKELLEVETLCLNEGFEGLMLRSVDGLYKYGRSTTKEGILLKLKRFAHDEAEVFGAYEQLENTNEATTDERGYKKRSSHKANMVGKGTLGGFHVKMLTGPFKGVACDVGTGWTDAERVALWADWNKKGMRLFNKQMGMLRLKYQLIGSKDRPRFPIADGWRSKDDTS